jgi:hypothetical protein
MAERLSPPSAGISLAGTVFGMARTQSLFQ